MDRLRRRRVMRPHPAVRIARIADPAAPVTGLRGSVAGALMLGDDAQAAYPGSFDDICRVDRQRDPACGAGSQSPRRTSSNQKQCRDAAPTSSASKTVRPILKVNSNWRVALKLKKNHASDLALTDVTWLESCAHWGFRYCCDFADQPRLGDSMRFEGELS